MLSRILDEIARDVESETDASSRLEKALKPNAKGVSRAQKLELITRVLDHACKSRSAAVENAFRIALGSLRDLTPFLKKKSASETDTIAAVEKYAVNFALLPTSDVSQQSVASYREDELITSLRRIFESRTNMRKTRRNTKRSTQLKRVQRRENKENEDPCTHPQKPTFIEDELTDRLFFPQAAALGIQMLLPDDDSVDIATTTSGALSIRLTKSCSDLPLGDILALAKGAVLPWLEYLRHFSDQKTQRTCVAYSKRVSSFLLDRCRTQQHDPATVLHAQIFALQLECPKLNQYARDVLQSAKNFSRTRKGDGDGQRTNEVLSSAYEYAMRYAENFEFSDHRWASEDVSAWLDDVALILAKQRPRRHLPQLFRSRFLTLRENAYEGNVLECLKLQVDLYDIGAYELDCGACPQEIKKLRHPALWKGIAAQLQDIQVGDLLDSQERAYFLAQPEETAEGWRVKEADGYRCLRLMRVLEPIRKFIVTGFSRCDLPEGAVTVLRIYLSALLRGFRVLSVSNPDGDSSGESAVESVVIRLNKMAGGGLEAANSLMCWYANEHLFDKLGDVGTVTEIILKYHESYSPSSARKWTEWLFSVMSSTNRKLALALKENSNDGKTVLMQLSETVLFCASQLLKFTNSTRSVSSGYLNVLMTVREGLLSHRLWAAAADVSFRLFEYATSSRIENRLRSVLHEIARITAQDALRLLQERKEAAFLTNLTIPADKLLSLFTEYSWWIRKNRSSIKTTEKYLEIIDRLTLLRRGVFQYCDLGSFRCPSLTAHQMWLSFNDKQSSLEKKKVANRWEARGVQDCNGHFTLGLMGSHDKSCAPAHLIFLENLRKACQDAALKSFGNLTDLLHTLDPGLPANKPLLGNVGISLFAMEALHWISSVLAFSSFGALSQQALTMANRFGSCLDISMTDEESVNVSVLDGLPRFMPTEFRQDEDMPRSSQVKDQSPLDVSHVMYVAKSTLKRSLKALWKCKIGLSEKGPQSYSVGGLSVNVDFNENSFSGRYRLGLILNLVDHLFRLGVLQSNIENISEARYYIDQSFRISESCLPPENNSMRRIAVMSTAKCVTKKESRPLVLESLTVHVPIEHEELEYGRDIQSCYTTLKLAADALLFVETAWQTRMLVSSPLADAYSDFIANVFERCQKILLEKQRLFSNFDRETERARLEIGSGLTGLLRGEKLAVCKLKSIIENENSVACDVRALASYELARLRINEAGGLQAFFPESSQSLRLRKDRPLRRSTRRHGRVNNSRRPLPPYEETRILLSRACRNLIPRIENLPLCRKTWNMAAMIENEPDAVAKRLAQTVGLSFDARYTCSTSNMTLKDSNSGVQLLEKGMRNLSLSQTDNTDAELDMSILRAISCSGNTVLVGVHMDENKSSIVIWRRCGSGFALKRVWLPPSGPQSYSAMLERMEAILDEVKRSSITEGQEMTKAEKVSWWEDRYRLDNQMKLVLTDIQEHWLGSATSLLIPSVFAKSEEATDTCNSDVSNYVTLAERACDGSDDEVILGDTVLLVDKPSERIPWESLPLLRENAVSVTRTPSMSYLSAMWAPDKCFDGNRLLYVLNPEGNLGRTENRFRGKLESEETWSGTVGVTSGEKVASLYDGQEVYLYCGHGAGEDFFSPSKICCRNRAPIALLMGCSSCRARDVEIGDYESNGPAIEFLTHGSAAVVGNLWDVSDGEIDRLTSSVLSLWFGDEVNEDNTEAEALSLAQALARSRSKCHLPYLVGAACIVMGVPHIFVSREAGG